MELFKAVHSTLHRTHKRYISLQSNVEGKTNKTQGPECSKMLRFKQVLHFVNTTNEKTRTLFNRKKKKLMLNSDFITSI